MSKTKDDRVSNLPVVTKSADVGAFRRTDAVTAFAAAHGVRLTDSIEERADRAAEAMNRSQVEMLTAGLLLISIKGECEHGQFTRIVEERGFNKRGAQKAMQYAEFVLSRPEDERSELLNLPKSKLMLLASADPEVVEVLAEDGVEAINALTVRELQDEIRSLKSEVANEEAIRQTAEARAETLQKRLAQHENRIRGDRLPVGVADLRAEMSALQRKAQLAIESFQDVAQDLLNLNGSSMDYVDGTLRLGVTALASLRLLVDGQLKRWVEALPEGDEPGAALVDVPATGYLTPQEIADAAQRWSQLAAVHEYEKKLREWEREQAKPKGKGRPMAKPEAPAGA